MAERFIREARTISGLNHPSYEKRVREPEMDGTFSKRSP
jgi:hypothetical protein